MVTGDEGVAASESASEEDESKSSNNNVLETTKEEQQETATINKNETTTSADLPKETILSNMKVPGRSMADRSKIPFSFWSSLICVVALQVFSGLFSSTTFPDIQNSWKISYDYAIHLLQYLQQLNQTFLILLPSATTTNNNNSNKEWPEFLVAWSITLLLAWLAYVLIGAPFLAGFWTGNKAHKHILHRYMGLLYLIQYPLAWLEFAKQHGVTNNSFLPHLVAFNGIVQAWSAFFSFKVLPELNDAGYYSDKSVLSRSFVHENAFFQLMCFFGSLYYNNNCRATLRSTWIGRCLEYLFIFWPYVLLRPSFPITRFRDAGQTHKGRSQAYQQFYEIGTYLVKIFFLYAKYFLGFYFNFMIFLDLPSNEDWKLLRGCLLLNIGTVSIAMFLHTLRFKKIFPGVFTFSIYLGQIYATILGIPFCYHVFSSHLKLMAVCALGLLCNMTRSRTVHAIWCFFTMCLLSYPGIEW